MDTGPAVDRAGDGHAGHGRHRAGREGHRRLPLRRLTAPAALLTLLSAAVLLAALAPADVVQGEAQRLMYLHVPAAWCAFLAFAVVLAASVRFLLRREVADQAWARAGAEVGVVLTALAILTGAVWGRLTWGAWWVWDARLTSTLALLLVYVAYLALRALVTGPRGQVLVAVLGACGFLLVPVVHFSVLWWRTLHQPPTLLAPSVSPPIDVQMALALAASLGLAMLLSGGLLRRRAMVLTGRPAHPRPARPLTVVP